MRTLFAWVVIVATSASLATAQSDSATNPADLTTPAGAALSTLFSPSKAPARKTMGLLQRSFLDLADQGDMELEVAILVDGTDSMATELAGVRNSINQMVSDLRKYRKNEVRVALVVYRDAGSPSGECVLPLKRFTADEAELAKAVESLVPESGAPFFHELPDVGLHKAITELPWTENPQVQHWILMFGDAPPYAEGFADADHPTARRRYGTDFLVALAVRKNIRINPVLCTSSQNVEQPYGTVIDETRNFMNALASGTDGLMLDLSYPEIRTALIDASKQPTVGLAQIKPITGIDLAAVQRAEIGRAPVSQPVSLAILPHAPLANMSFDPESDSVQVSTALRLRFSQLPGVRIASPLDVQRQLRRLQADGISADQAVRALAARLKADYVLWGSVEPNTARVQSAAYRRSDGQRVVQVSFDGDRGKLANVLLTAASSEGNASDDAFANLSQQMKSLALKEAFDQPIANDAGASREILAAMESLEQSLASVAGEESGAELLKRADDSCRAALVSEPRNAIAHWLSSNIAYNQSMRLFKIGDMKAAEERMREMKSSLKRAVREKRDVEVPSLVTEIEADYALLVDRDIPAAIAKYTELTNENAPQQSQLRGHWMLAGIYAGDWAVDESNLNADLARENIVQILANWPDSPEATLLKQWLRWDDSTEQTEFNYLPRMNAQLSEVTGV